LSAYATIPGRSLLRAKEGDGDSLVEAAATLVAEPYQVWWIDECNLISRQAASRMVRERIVQLLGQVGIKVAVRGFQDAWDELSSGSATPRIEDLWDMTWADQN
jgi:hypothetical protein